MKKVLDLRIVTSSLDSQEPILTPVLWKKDNSDEDDDTSTAYSYLNNFEYTIYAVNYKLLDCGIIHLFIFFPVSS